MNGVEAEWRKSSLIIQFQACLGNQNGKKKGRWKIGRSDWNNAYKTLGSNRHTKYCNTYTLLIVCIKPEHMALELWRTMLNAGTCLQTWLERFSFEGWIPDADDVVIVNSTEDCQRREARLSLSSIHSGKSLEEAWTTWTCNWKIPTRRASCMITKIYKVGDDNSLLQQQRAHHRLMKPWEHRAELRPCGDLDEGLRKKEIHIYI